MLLQKSGCQGGLWARSRAKTRAVSKPMPLFAPVTTTTRPLRSGTSAAVLALTALAGSGFLPEWPIERGGSCHFGRFPQPVCHFGRFRAGVLPFWQVRPPGVCQPRSPAAERPTSRQRISTGSRITAMTGTSISSVAMKATRPSGPKASGMSRLAAGRVPM